MIVLSRAGIIIATPLMDKDVFGKQTLVNIDQKKLTKMFS